jgi:hypothetical protein
VRQPFHPRRLFQFSLSTLLWVMLCVCGYFGGYRAGQSAAARDRFNQLPTARVYDLSDLTVDLPTTAHRQRLYRELVAHLQAAVPPQEWKEAGGVRCGIHTFLATDSVAVLQRGPLHEHIEAALQEFRRRRETTTLGMNSPRESPPP